jgi:hypothetical protein
MKRYQLIIYSININTVISNEDKIFYLRVMIDFARIIIHIKAILDAIEF